MTSPRSGKYINLITGRDTDDEEIERNMVDDIKIVKQFDENHVLMAQSVYRNGHIESRSFANCDGNISPRSAINLDETIHMESPSTQLYKKERTKNYDFIHHEI